MRRWSWMKNLILMINELKSSYLLYLHNKELKWGQSMRLLTECFFLLQLVVENIGKLTWDNRRSGCFQWLKINIYTKMKYKNVSWGITTLTQQKPWNDEDILLCRLYEFLEKSAEQKKQENQDKKFNNNEIIKLSIEIQDYTSYQPK